MARPPFLPWWVLPSLLEPGRGENMQEPGAPLPALDQGPCPSHARPCTAPTAEHLKLRQRQAVESAEQAGKQREGARGLESERSSHWTFMSMLSPPQVGLAEGPGETTQALVNKASETHTAQCLGSSLARMGQWEVGGEPGQREEAARGSWRGRAAQAAGRQSPPGTKATLTAASTGGFRSVLLRPSPEMVKIAQAPHIWSTPDKVEGGSGAWTAWKALQKGALLHAGTGPQAPASRGWQGMVVYEDPWLSTTGHHGP